VEERQCILRERRQAMGDRVSLHSIRRGKMEGSQSRCLIATRQEHLLGRNANNLQLSVSRTQSPSSAVANSFSITPVARSAPLCPPSPSARSSPPLSTPARSSTATTTTIRMAATRRNPRKMPSVARPPLSLYFVTTTRLRKLVYPSSLQ
jgi:hypothetical protein